VEIKKFKKNSKIRALMTLFCEAPHRRGMRNSYWTGKYCRIYLYKEKLDKIGQSYPYGYYTRGDKPCTHKITYREVVFDRDYSIYSSKKIEKLARQRMQLLRY
jgi:hypothetical protein